jgi:enoyl-CoA hydratase
MSVSYDINDRVAVVTLHRPERRNAVDAAAAAALADAFRRFDADEAADVAVLYGDAGSFCAGADLKAIAEGRGNRIAEDGDGPMGPTRLRLSKPVIAAIEGHAVAGGMELAMWCDLRVMAEDALLGIFCRRFGVPLIDGGTVRLARLIGESRAMELILTGRPVTAHEAHHIGLAHRVVPHGEALAGAVVWAREIAALPQTCLRSDRRSLMEQWSLSEEQALRNELRLGVATLQSEESREGAERFARGEGRHGRFES